MRGTVYVPQVTEALLSTTLVFGLNVAMTVWSAYLIDRIGRKTLLMRGSAMMTTSVLLLGVVLKLLPVRWTQLLAYLCALPARRMCMTLLLKRHGHSKGQCKAYSLSRSS